MPSQLILDERALIAIGIQQEFPEAKIAEMLDRSESTIYREINRNSINGEYDALEAHARAQGRHRRTGKKLDNPILRRRVEKELKAGLSPEQITGRLEREGGPTLSFQSIYNWLKDQGQEFQKHLRRGSRLYKKLVGGESKHQRIRGGRSIKERPKVVDERSRFGDWEADMVMSAGQRTGIATLVERKSGFLITFKMDNRRAVSFIRGLKRIVQQNPGLPFHTITVDQGMEFSTHYQIEEVTGAKVYYAEPYKPYQRGCVENANGLLRQYFPKGTDFMAVSAQQLAAICRKLNRRPRKRLKFNTPAELMLKYFNFAVGL